MDCYGESIEKNINRIRSKIDFEDYVLSTVPATEENKSEHAAKVEDLHAAIDIWEAEVKRQITKNLATGVVFGYGYPNPQSPVQILIRPQYWHFLELDFEREQASGHDMFFAGLKFAIWAEMTQEEQDIVIQITSPENYPKYEQAHSHLPSHPHHAGKAVDPEPKAEPVSEASTAPPTQLGWQKIWSNATERDEALDVIAAEIYSGQTQNELIPDIRAEVEQRHGVSDLGVKDGTIKKAISTSRLKQKAKKGIS